MLAVAMLFLVASTVGTDVPPDAPTINGFSPTSGPVGTLVRVSGSNLKDVQSVQFGSRRAEVVHFVSESELTAEVPVGATTGLITVVTDHGIATSPGPFTVTVPTVPTSTPTPTMTSTPTPTATPVPTATPTPEPARIVEETCWSYLFELGPNITRLDSEPVHSQVLQQLQAHFDEALNGGRKAGFVLTFAQGPDDGSSTRAAQRINDMLLEADAAVFQSAAKKAYLARGRAQGRVEVQVYYLSGGGAITNAERCAD
jgi:hypothetical protein